MVSLQVQQLAHFCSWYILYNDLNLVIKFCKVHHFADDTNLLNLNTLKSIYFAIFDSHIIYVNLIWGQNLNSTFRIVTLQEKAIRIISNQSRNSHSGLFISKSINNLQQLIFKNWFVFSFDIYKYNTVSSSADKLFNPPYRTPME